MADPARVAGSRVVEECAADRTWPSEGGATPPKEATGLYHFAIRYTNRRDLALTLQRVLDAGVTIDSSSDCGGIADSVYLRDPAPLPGAVLTGSWVGAPDSPGGA